MLPELQAPGTQLGVIDARRRAGNRHPGGHAAVCGRRRQGLRSAGRGLRGAARRLPELRHHGDDQHDQQALCRGHALRAAVSVRHSRRLQHRSAGVSRLLDGELVQGAVRPPRAAAGPGRRPRARAALRPAGRIGAAGLDGPDAAALLDARHPGAGARSEGRDRRFRRRPHARPRLPRHPRGTGLCAARREGAHRTAQRRAHHRAAGVGRRLAERRGDAAHGRHLRLADRAPARLRNLGPGRGDRRRRGFAAVSGFRQCGGGDDARGQGVRADRGQPRHLRPAL